MAGRFLPHLLQQPDDAGWIVSTQYRFITVPPLAVHRQHVSADKYYEHHRYKRSGDAAKKKQQREYLRH
jgi:hypothetical protein